MSTKDTAKSKGYDAGKKVSGIKRHIAVDTHGLPHAVTVSTAEVMDRQGALQALRGSQGGLDQVQSIQGHAQALGRRAQFRLAGEEQKVVEKLRASSLSEILCVRHNMRSERSMYAEQADEERAGVTGHSERSH